MRGTRVKALRTPERPNPGRKNGGVNKADVKREGYHWYEKVANVIPIYHGRRNRRTRTRG